MIAAIAYPLRWLSGLIEWEGRRGGRLVIGDPRAIGTLAGVGILGMSLYFIGVGVGGGATSGGTGSPTAAVGAPTAPTITLVSPDSSTIYVTFSAFAGSGSDTQDSIRVIVLRSGAADTLFDAKSGVQTTDTVSDNSDLKADSTYRVLGRQKGASGGWSGEDTVSITLSTFAANKPAGLVEVVDYQAWGTYEDTTPPASSGEATGTLGGLTITDHNRDAYPNDLCHTIADATAPNTSGRVWESYFDNGAGGSSPCKITKSLTLDYDTVYVAWYQKYSSGWEENSNSMKMLYTYYPTAYKVFEYQYRAESVFETTSATGCNHLEANQANVAVKSPPESGNCSGQRQAFLTAGQWDQFEWLWICTSSTTVDVKWWKNGELRGSHTGRTAGCGNQIIWYHGWGGGLTLSQEQNYRLARVAIHRSTN